jgi:hypothetical protein
LELKHKQVEVYNPFYEENIRVDEGMAELLTLLWDMDIFTTVSCQETEPGFMWLNMPADEATLFMMALSFKRDDDLKSDPPSLYPRMMMMRPDSDDSWKYHVRPRDEAEKYIFEHEDDDFSAPVKLEGQTMLYFDIHISFPISDYPLIMERLTIFKKQMDIPKRTNDS